jgi:hypothetical protein
MSVPPGRLPHVTTSREMLAERFARHGLAHRPCRTPREAVAITTAVQAQDALAGRLGVRARAPELSDADTLHALEVERSIARTSLMRGTIHLVDTADLRWLVRLIGPSIARKFRTRWTQLGLTEPVLERTAAALPALLADGPRTRREIRAGLTAAALLPQSPDPQAVDTHVTLHASTLGLICRGPDRGRDATFVLIDDWVPDAPAGPSGDAALAELARRYFAAYSPASAADFAAWSGLAAGPAVALIRDELDVLDVDGRQLFRRAAADPVRGVRLAPAFDNYLIGYRDRSALIATEHVPAVYQGGWIRPTVLRDGRVIGAWALDRAAGRVSFEPFEAWPRATRAQVAAEVGDIGRFLGRELRLELP